MKKDKEKKMIKFVETEWGIVSISWGNKGVKKITWPQKIEKSIEPLSNNYIGIVPKYVELLEVELKKFFSGYFADFSKVKIDLDGVPKFFKKVYLELRKIPYGQTITYSELAKRVGSPKAFRAVGLAMARNPIPIVIPCHRVVATSGKIGGFSAPGGSVTKKHLLDIESKLTPCTPKPCRFNSNVPFDVEKAKLHLLAVDKTLGKLIERVGEFKLVINSMKDVFETLFESIIYQQLTPKAAKAILSRVKGLFVGKVLPTPSQVLYTSEEAFRSAGLSRFKIAAIKDLAQKTIERAVPELHEIESMLDEEIIDKLTKIRGIGRWTVEMLLIFRLGRPDVFPIDDLGIKKGFALTYGLDKLPTKQIMIETSEKWRPYRTMASWYLWRANDFLKIKNTELDKKKR